MMQRLWMVLVCVLSASAAAQDEAVSAPQAEGVAEMGGRFEIEPGSTVLIVGNTFAERLDESGYFHALIHAAHPEHKLRIRSVAWSGDTVSLRPREMGVPTMLDHVDGYDPDVIFMFFGMVDSFEGEAGLAPFEADLRGLIERVGTKGDGTVRRVVLVGPMKHEARIGGTIWGHPIQAHNEDVTQYAEVIQRLAADIDAVVGVDLTKGIRRGFNGFATSNGIHPNDPGAFYYSREIGQQLGWVEDNQSIGILNDREARDFLASVWSRDLLVAAAADAHWYQRLIYRPTNTEYVWGRRHEPFGIVNFPAEFEQLERMLAAREARIWAMDKPSPAEMFQTYGPVLAGVDRPNQIPVWPTLPLDLNLPEDEWTPPSVEAKGTETSLGSTEILPPEEFVESFTLADGYVAEIFASEQDFPELANPLALTWDERHRLWVLCAITYPHLLPGERPRCKLLILEDTDGDGRADTRTVFADELYIPTGFGVDSTVDGVTEVYVGQSPDLLKLTDVDGDSVADVREIVATGFAMPDSHHQLSAFEWDPMGGLWMHEGVFSISNVETPWGVRRTRDAAAWRLTPGQGARPDRLDVMSHCGFANPWGLVFDDFGAGILADASGGSNYALSHVVHAFEYPRKPGRPGHILNRGRPTAGAEIIASRHFPDDVQGSFLVNQSIGFHGTRWDRLELNASSWRPESMPKDLIASSDTNFRPVAIETGPDGAVYIVDWCNPLIGHMQYSTRDPRRDASHGRIWRVRHETRELLTPPEIVGATAQELCELLRLPEWNTRQLVRRRLQRLPEAEIESVVLPWFEALDAAMDRDYWRLQLEKLWLTHALGTADMAQMESLVFGPNAQAKGGALRVLRHWLEEGRILDSDAARFVERAVVDDDMHVRLEGVIAAGFMSPARGIGLAERSLEQSMDGAMRTVLTETLVHLSRGMEEVPEIVRALRLRSTGTDKLLEMEADELVVHELLGRYEVPVEQRMELLAGLVGEDAGDQAAALFDRLADERALSDAGPLLDLFKALPVDAVESAAATDERWIEHDDRFLAAKVASVLLVLGIEPERLIDDEAGLLVRAVGRAGADGGLSERVRGRLVEIAGHAFGGLRDELGVWERQLALSQALRFAGEDRAAVMEDVVAVVERGWKMPLSEWGTAQRDAMTAQLALHSMDESDWSESAAAYATDRGSSEARILGEEIYFDEAIGCVRCHARNGSGLEGFPPLAGSKRLLGDPARAASVVLHGLYGPIEGADGAVYNSAMEPLGGVLSDEEIAAVLTHARQSFGNFAPSVEPEVVAAERQRVVPGGSYWPIAELDSAFPLATDSLGGRLRAVANPSAASAAGPQSPPGSRSLPLSPLAILGLAIVALGVLVVGFGVVVLKIKGSN